MWLWLRTWGRFERSRPDAPDRVGTCKIGSAGQNRRQDRSYPSPEHPLPWENQVDRTSSRPWATPMIDI